VRVPAIRVGRQAERVISAQKSSQEERFVTPSLAKGHYESLPALRLGKIRMLISVF